MRSLKKNSAKVVSYFSRVLTAHIMNNINLNVQCFNTRGWEGGKDTEEDWMLVPKRQAEMRMSLGDP